MTKDGKTLWPKDYLRSDFPNCRIMTFGYRSDQVLWDQPSRSLAATTNYLLDELMQRRRDVNPPTRPIIFVAHSLGGLIVKNALIEASEAIEDSVMDKLTLSIQQCTKGVVFFGTPHKGHADASMYLQQMHSDAKSLIDEELGVARTLDDPLSFQVGRYLSIDKMVLNFLIVPDEEETANAARPPSIKSSSDARSARGEQLWWFTYRVHRPTTDLVKFIGRNDVCYQRVKSCVRRVIEGELPTQRASQQPQDKLVLTNAIQNSRQAELENSRALFDKAEIELTSVLQELECLPNACKDDFLSVLDELALHFERRQNYVKAELIYTHIFLMLYEGDANLEAASTIDQLSDTAKEQQRLKAADAMVQASRAAREQGRLGSALRFLQRARYICTQLKDSPDNELRMASIDIRRAIILDEQGKYSEAQTLYERAHKVRCEHLEPSHAKTLDAAENLAVNCRLVGQLNKARKILEEVLPLREEKCAARIPTPVSPEEREFSPPKRTHTYTSSHPSTEDDPDEALKATVQRLTAVYHDMGDHEKETELIKKWTPRLEEGNALVNIHLDSYVCSPFLWRWGLKSTKVVL